MPYHISKQGDKECVVKDDGKTMHCYSGDGAHSQAVNYLQALYANVKKSEDGFAEFSMAIVKATNKNGEMRIRTVNSDTEEDFFEERMSTDLFEDMIYRIENDVPFPEEFKSVICEEDWCGGMPYISLAHYKSGKGRVNVPGEVLSVYMDGKKLKSTGRIFDTPLGRSVYRSIEKDLEEKAIEDKIRISIGFLDLEHSHGDKFTFVRKSVGQKCPLCSKGVGDKIYKKGVLVHLALTRKPANPRTDVEVEKSMTTKREDLESLLDDKSVLENLELKSTATDDLLVVKTNDNDADEKGKCPEGDEECEKKMGDKSGDEGGMMKSATVETIVVPAPVAPAPAVAEVVTRTALDEAIEVFKNKVASLKSAGIEGDNALRELQSSFDGLGAVVKSEFAHKQTPEEIVKSTMESTLRSLLQEMLPQMLPQALTNAVAPIQQEVSELRALSTAAPTQSPRREEVPNPRSLNLNLVQKSAVEQIQKTSSWSQLANKSVGLPENFVR